MGCDVFTLFVRLCHAKAEHAVFVVFFFLVASSVISSKLLEIQSLGMVR